MVVHVPGVYSSTAKPKKKRCLSSKKKVMLSVCIFFIYDSVPIGNQPSDAAFVFSSGAY